MAEICVKGDSAGSWRSSTLSPDFRLLSREGTAWVRPFLVSEPGRVMIRAFYYILGAERSDFAAPLAGEDEELRDPPTGMPSRNRFAI